MAAPSTAWVGDSLLQICRYRSGNFVNPVFGNMVLKHAARIIAPACRMRIGPDLPLPVFRPLFNYTANPA